jgi:hypothetical protein
MNFLTLRHAPSDGRFDGFGPGERQPYLPRFMAGGDGNPLGARALYLGERLYRIHGTNQPSTIATFVSSGCIQLTNEDIMDLYTRVKPSMAYHYPVRRFEAP